MNKYDFLKKYQKLQDSVMFDGLVDLGFAQVGWSNTDTSSFWNLALVNSLLKTDEIEKVEELLTKVSRKTTFYFENREELKQLVQTLENRNYKMSFEDSWLFWKGGETSSNRFELVKKVDAENLLNEFLATFDKCYQKDDPQNAYGELGEYLKVAREVWYKHNQSGRLQYFIIYKDSKPVAVSTLSSFEGIGYISNVGSLKEVRGEGFGKLATLYCISESIKNGNQEHCLATEEDTYANDFYKKIGFETRFTALGYTKQ